MRHSPSAPWRCFAANERAHTLRLGVDDAMTPKRETPWRGIAILLGLLLCAVLFAAALVVSGIMKLGFSLL